MALNEKIQDLYQHEHAFRSAVANGNFPNYGFNSLIGCLHDICCLLNTEHDELKSHLQSCTNHCSKHWHKLDAARAWAANTRFRFQQQRCQFTRRIPEPETVREVIDDLKKLECLLRAVISTPKLGCFF